MVERSTRGWGEDRRPGASGRWSLGECLGKVWGEEAAYGAGNFQMGSSWVRSGFQEAFGEMWVRFSVGRKGGVAGGLGEIGG